jgi:hypothetical protein
MNPDKQDMTKLIATVHLMESGREINDQSTFLFSNVSFKYWIQGAENAFLVISASKIPYIITEERDQRDIFRGTFTNLIANSTYTLLITYVRNNRDKVENTFQFKTLPLQNLVLKITSNVLES